LKQKNESYFKYIEPLSIAKDKNNNIYNFQRFNN